MGVVCLLSFLPEELSEFQIIVSEALSCNNGRSVEIHRLVKAVAHGGVCVPVEHETDSVFDSEQRR